MSNYGPRSLVTWNAFCSRYISSYDLEGILRRLDGCKEQCLENKDFELARDIDKLKAIASKMTDEFKNRERVQ